MHDCCPDDTGTCSSVVYQSVDVGLPISLTPDVAVGKLKIKCCGEPLVVLRQAADGNGRCEIMVTQSLSYRIPIVYSVASDVSDAICECTKKHCFGV